MIEQRVMADCVKIFKFCHLNFTADASYTMSEKRTCDNANLLDVASSYRDPVAASILQVNIWKGLQPILATLILLITMKCCT